MKLDHKQKEYLLYGSLAVGGLIIITMFKGGGSPPSAHHLGQGGQPRQAPMPNPGQASLDQAIVQARTAALTAYDQSVVQQGTTRAALSATINTNETNKLIAFNTNQAQTTQTRIQSASMVSIANIEKAMQEAVASTQASAVTTLGQQQQQTSLWQSIFGFFSSALPFLQAKPPTSNPYGSTTTYVPGTPGGLIS